uniref:Uncharacterized protein n=1 Tax=Strigamia maritima TaxID=126957 RepID=T1J2B8_STRMM
MNSDFQMQGQKTFKNILTFYWQFLCCLEFVQSGSLEPRDMSLTDCRVFHAIAFKAGSSLKTFYRKMKLKGIIKDVESSIKLARLSEDQIFMSTVVQLSPSICSNMKFNLKVVKTSRQQYEKVRDKIKNLRDCYQLYGENYSAPGPATVGMNAQTSLVGGFTLLNRELEPTNEEKHKRDFMRKSLTCNELSWKKIKSRMEIASLQFIGPRAADEGAAKSSGFERISFFSSLIRWLKFAFRILQQLGCMRDPKTSKTNGKNKLNAKI